MKKRQNKTKIAFDCHVIASTLLGGITRSLFLEVLNFSNQIDIYYCEELLTEIRQLSKSEYFISKGITAEVMEDFVDFFEKRAIKVTLKPKHEINRNDKANYLLDLCVDANLDYLISADKNLVVMGVSNSAKILPFAAFMEEFNFLPF
jgi:putative PIN family toxin of toxin-antitoxin system